MNRSYPATLSLLLLPVLFFFNLTAHAQTPNWQWAKSAGGTDWEEAYDIAVDGSGNSYVTGFFRSNTITFGTITLSKITPVSVWDDVFIVKYDPLGNVLWAKNAGSSEGAHGRSIAVDGSGNCYVTGYYGSSISFGSTTLTSAGMADIFVVKYDPSGNVIWAKSFGGLGADQGMSIAVDGVGNSYVTGHFISSSSSFGSITLTNAGGTNKNDAFVVKLDISGSVLWAKSAGGTDHEFGRDITVDGNGNSYVTGEFVSSTSSFGSTNLTNAGGTDVFLAKYNASGNLLWAKSAGGTGSDRGTGIGVDGSGNSYISGWFSGVVSFGSTILTSAGGADVFVAKYDPSGNEIWAKCAGGTGSDFASGIAVEGNGNSYITGNFGSSSISFGSATLNITGGTDVFVAKYDPSGNVFWATSSGGTGGETGNGIAANGNGNCYVTGSFNNGSINFGSLTLASAGNRDVFVAKLGVCMNEPALPGTISGNMNPCAGSSQIYSVPAAAGITFYIWYLPSGWTGTSATNTITVNIGATSGAINVAAVNSCGTSLLQTLPITVLPAPSPIITQVVDTLSVTLVFNSYQWYLNGNPISGATNQSYTATQTGNYHVVVTDANNCSGQSNTMGITVGIEEVVNDKEILIVPNPISDLLFIKSKKSIGAISIYDGLGRKVLEKNIAETNGEVNMQHLPEGLYLLKAGETIIKLIKE